MILDKIPRSLSGSAHSSTSRTSSTSNAKETSYSPSDLAFIRSLALSPNCFAILVNSLCGSIFGHELVKAGLLLGLMGGTPHREESGGGGQGGDFRIRSDIHVLVVGDPGLGKVSSQLFCLLFIQLSGP